MLFLQSPSPQKWFHIKVSRSPRFYFIRTPRPAALDYHVDEEAAAVSSNNLSCMYTTNRLELHTFSSPKSSYPFPRANSRFSPVVLISMTSAANSPHMGALDYWPPPKKNEATYPLISRRIYVKPAGCRRTDGLLLEMAGCRNAGRSI